MLKLLNFSIVVVAEHHNPTILNPDFLARNGIIPDEWNWQRSEECFSTPPLAQVRYTNGVTIICEQSKLQIVDDGDGIDPNSSRIADVAMEYVRVLPHVRYTAIGVNFRSVIPRERPVEALIDRFLKPGPWNEAANPLQDVALRFVYPVNGGRLRLSLEPGATRGAQTTGESIQAILAGANYHHDLGKGHPVAEVERIVSRKSEYWQHFHKMLSQIVEYDGSEVT